MMDRHGDSIATSSTLATYIYADPSVQERLTQGLTTTPQQRVASMTEALKKLGDVIDGKKK